MRETKIQDIRVIKVVCRLCREVLHNRFDMSYVLIDAIEHQVRFHQIAMQQSESCLVAVTFVGFRNEKPVKHTLAVI